MTSAKIWTREWRVLLEWAAGFTSTVFFHQPTVWLLYTAGIVPRGPYNMAPVPPFGIPAVISLAFWGGVWGIIMIPAIARIRGEAAWFAAAAVFGAVLPTLVAFFVAAPLKHQPIPHGVKPFLTGFAVNAAWGIGTAILFRFFARSK